MLDEISGQVMKEVWLEMASELDQYRAETDNQIEQRLLSMNNVKSEVLGLADKLEWDQLTSKEIKGMVQNEIGKKIDIVQNNIHAL